MGLGFPVYQIMGEALLAGWVPRSAEVCAVGCGTGFNVRLETELFEAGRHLVSCCQSVLV